MTTSAFPTLGGVSLSWRHENDLAAKAGLAAGDLIISLNKTLVSDHVEALAIADVSGRQEALQLLRVLPHEF